MKVQNIIQLQALVIGFAAVLFLASSASAQEIVNTSFEDGPNVVAISETAAPVAGDLNSPRGEPQSANGATVIGEPTVVREAGISLRTTLEGWLLTSLLLGIAIVALYALSEAKRANRNLAARLGQMKGRSALS